MYGIDRENMIWQFKYGPVKVSHMFKIGGKFYFWVTSGKRQPFWTLFLYAIEKINPSMFYKIKYVYYTFFSIHMPPKSLTIGYIINVID